MATAPLLRSCLQIHWFANQHYRRFFYNGFYYVKSFVFFCGLTVIGLILFATFKPSNLLLAVRTTRQNTESRPNQLRKIGLNLTSARPTAHPVVLKHASVHPVYINSQSIVYSFLKDTNSTVDIDKIKNDTIVYGSFKKQALAYYFAPKMKPLERTQMLETLRVCLAVVEQIGIKYFLYGGTLIGYQRHDKSIIPWDDDADVALIVSNDSQMLNYVIQLKEAIRQFPSHDITYVIEQQRLKCYGQWDNNSQAVKDPKWQWRWPFVDLQFTKIITPPGWHGDPILQDSSNTNFLFPLEQIYPLRRTYFTEKDIPVFVPNYITSVLKASYGDLTMCISSDYNHRTENPPKRIVQVECKELTFLYTFSALILH